ncbi:TIGR04028 family ABC transporter substrate-binding protein [Occultella aeris]|uniref:Periplasmic dipeptide transport protein n=1 Tax=Occultella aeris TaxID=2761496 RepID=A0A7M4DIL8_9MICO|nr:TIGR04028 family ABC transporter substrate-binding protein [Occultella aeris]VZO36828.1 Periplasmic dipeptide transport protein precursor [Occultella aeris]
MIRTHRGWQGAAALGATLALVLTACGSDGGSGGNGEPSGDPVTGGTLVYLEHQPHDTLYPPAAGFYPNGGLVNNITDRLVYQDPETLEFEPWIATDWEINEDATQYTFNLRSDVTFSDGSALDAEVVAANFDLYGLGDPDRALTVSEAVNNYASSEVVDADTVVFNFSAPAPGFLQATSTINSGLVSASTLEGAFEDFGPGNGQNVIGSGPFVISAEEIGTSVTLSAREDYAWAPAARENQGRAYVDEVQVTVTPEDSVRVGALTSGQADVIRYVEAQDEAQVAGAGLDIYAPQTRGVNNSLSLRFTNPILSDLRVRQALIAGIDRQQVVDTIYTENYPLATSSLSSTALGYTDLEEYYAFDPEHAAELLDEAGWTLGADGIRERDGQPLTLVVNEAAPQPRSFEALTLISQQLAEIGVDLQILRADAGTYTEAIQDADQVQIYHSMVGRADLDVIKSQYYSTNRNTLLNRDPATDAIADPELEALLAAVASEADGDTRIANSQAVQTYLAENAYVIPLFEEPQVFGSQTDVEGLSFESVGRPSFYEVWLDR